MTFLAQAQKSVFASKTFWGLVVAFAAGVAPLLGTGVTSNDVTTVATKAFEFGGLIYALYGRVIATQQVGLLPSSSA